MKRQTRLTAFALCAVLALALTVPAAHAEADTPGFPDVAADSWYAEAAAYCLAHGLMEGCGGVFAPEIPMTRAMLVTVLYRAAGSPPAQGEDVFPDVPAGAWYADAVCWCGTQGIVTGDENGLFRGEVAVSCQDAATLLWRFAGHPEAGSDGGLADMEQVSLYARTAVAWARTAGILDGSLPPRDGVTRAQAARMIMRYQRLQAVVPDILSVTSAACEPCGIAAMEDGALLISDAYNKVIWRASGGEGTVYAGRQSVADIYGQPVGGYYDGSLDASLFRSPWAIAPFLDGYAVTDAENGAIRFLCDGKVQTLNCTTREDSIPKNGSTVRFTYPTGLAAGNDGCLYVSDTYEDAIRKITPNGEVATFVRGLSDPMGLCWKDGTLYVADTGSNRILKIEDGEVSVAAGSGEDGFLDGSAGEAAFSVPQGVAVDDGGVIYVADTGNSAVRRIQDGEVTTLYARDAADLDALYPISPVGLLIAEDRLYVCDIFAQKVLILPLQ